MKWKVFCGLEARFDVYIQGHHQTNQTNYSISFHPHMDGRSTCFEYAVRSVIADNSNNTKEKSTDQIHTPALLPADPLEFRYNTETCLQKAI